MKLTKNIKGKQKKRLGLDKVVYLNNKRFTMRTNKKKDRIDRLVERRVKACK